LFTQGDQNTPFGKETEGFARRNPLEDESLGIKDVPVRGQKRKLKVCLYVLFLLAFVMFVFWRNIEGPPQSLPAKRTVKLGFPGTNSVFQGLLGVAQEKRFIEEELEKIGHQIEFASFSGMGPAVNEALAGNKIDLAIYADFPGIISKSRGVNTVLLGIPEKSVHAVVVVKRDSPIVSVRELKGKKIGLTKGTFVQKFLLHLLADNGLSGKDVELIDLVSDLQTALVSGNVDALVLIQSQALQLTMVQKVAREIDSSTRTPSESSQFVFVGAHRFVKDNQGAIVAIHKGLIRARDFFRNDPGPCYEAITRSGMELEVVRELFQKEAPDFDLFTIGITEDSIGRLDETQKFMAENGLIEKRFDSAQWADNSYYEKARQ
jgi:sulfonate transport system substrate-binding protein